MEELWREACDLSFDQFCAVFGTSIRHVAVCPRGMLAHWGSGWIEQRRLTEKNERLIAIEGSLRFGNLFKQGPKVHGRASRTFRSSPGNRGAQRIVDFEGACAIPETIQLPALMRRQLRACEPKKLSGSDVGEDSEGWSPQWNALLRFEDYAQKPL